MLILKLILAPKQSLLTSSKEKDTIANLYSDQLMLPLFRF
jgi:hypothetical protein